jgi:hypothetical protein
VFVAYSYVPTLLIPFESFKFGCSIAPKKSCSLTRLKLCSSIGCVWVFGATSDKFLKKLWYKSMCIVWVFFL